MPNKSNISYYAHIFNEVIDYHMTKTKIFIGRNASSTSIDLALGASSYISKKHLELIWFDHCLYLRCLGKNGIFINGDFKAADKVIYALPLCSSLRFPSTSLELFIDAKPRPRKYWRRRRAQHTVGSFMLSKKNNANYSRLHLCKGNNIQSECLSHCQLDTSLTPSDIECCFASKIQTEIAEKIQKAARNRRKQPLALTCLKDTDTEQSSDKTYTDFAMTSATSSKCNGSTQPQYHRQLDDMIPPTVTVSNASDLSSLNGLSHPCTSAQSTCQLVLSSHPPGMHHIYRSAPVFSTDAATASRVPPTSANTQTFNKCLLIETPPYLCNRKPPFSFAQLIVQALASQQSRKLTLAAIYGFISRRYPFYQMNDKGWQNSVRHNLSLNRYFIKLPRKQNEPGKGCFWRIDPHHEIKLASQAFRRRRPRPEAGIWPSDTNGVSSSLPGLRPAIYHYLVPTSSTLSPNPATRIKPSPLSCYSTTVPSATNSPLILTSLPLKSRISVHTSSTNASTSSGKVLYILNHQPISSFTQ